MAKYPNLKFNVSPEEKELVQKLAKNSGLTVSKFIKEQLAPILDFNETVNISYKEKNTRKNRKITCFVSDEEYKIIKKNAGNKSLSSYLRKLALDGNNVINIEVCDNDVIEMQETIQPMLQSFEDTIKILRPQKQLHQPQADRMEEKLDEMLMEIRNFSKNILKERESIKKARLRELRKKYR